MNENHLIGRCVLGEDDGFHLTPRVKDSLSRITAKHVAWLKDKGWYGNKTPLESIALIASEIGEAANECRGEKPTDKLPSELADIILRTLSLAHELGIDMDKAVEEKIQYNWKYKKNTPGRIK
ncbi:MAG: MazG-like family protein [Nitrosopumilaceae archaeon]